MAVFAACTLLAGFLAACGGSDGSTTTLSKVEVIAQGEAICKRAKREQIKLFKAYGKNLDQSEPRNAQLERLAAEVALPPIETAIEELAGIGTPSAIVTGLEEAVEAVEADPVAFVQRPQEEVFGDVAKRANAYGLKTCAKLG